MMAALIELVWQSGNAVMDIYRSDIFVSKKRDGSFVTNADQAAEKIILRGLLSIAPDIPVISEEASDTGQKPGAGNVFPGRSFFLVDPLDGTAGFIKHDPHFTINIALVEHERPYLGVIFAPAINRLFAGMVDFGAIEASPGSHKYKNGTSLIKTARFLTGSKNITQSVSLLVGRSPEKPNSETFINSFMDKLLINKKEIIGSSLKFCKLAAGEADVYPRAGPTMEWDTAAGQAILQSAGGIVLTREGKKLRYGKKCPDYKNPPFIAWSNTALPAQLHSLTGRP